MGREVVLGGKTVPIAQEFQANNTAVQPAGNALTYLRWNTRCHPQKTWSFLLCGGLAFQKEQRGLRWQRCLQTDE
jgi:hypothetical protein